MQGAPAPPIRIAIYRATDALERIRPAWDALLAAAERHSTTSAYPYVLCAWVVLAAKEPGATLAVIGAWRGDVLAGIWPLCVRRGWLGRVADHLGDFSTFQSAGPVLRQDEDGGATAAALFDAAAGLADVLRAQNLRVGTRAHAVVTGRGGFRRFRGVDAPVVRVAGFASLADWVATRSKAFRYDLRAARKRLEEKGRLAFVQITEPAEARRLVDWMIDTKQAQLKAGGVRRSYLGKPELRAVLRRLAEAGPESGALFHALTLDGAMIAASLCQLGSDVLEFQYFAVEPSLEAASPGKLLIAECLGLAIARGLDFDFRFSREAYKLRWAGSDSERSESVFIACTPLGRLSLICEALWLRFDDLLEKAGYR